MYLGSLFSVSSIVEECYLHYLFQLAKFILFGIVQGCGNTRNFFGGFRPTDQLYFTTSLEMKVKTRFSHKSVNATGGSSFIGNSTELK